MGRIQKPASGNTVQDPATFNRTGEQKMKNATIMLVDDEERFLSTTRKLLEKRGYNAITASNGNMALELLDRKPVHVVILDVKMPGMDGIETLKAIKARHPMVEVIMLTGHATVESAVQGLKSGAVDYLMKPADIDDLVVRVEEAYARRQQLDEKIRMIQLRKHMGSPRNIIKGMQ